ncbi:hypothetical protein EJJ36_14920 [Acinetobacter junii]|uniref:hypothetical protein n=1 Tax=Acinetobacter junii TaxID=40215 RepID=UPI000F7E103D|nr:hypothetical protein [Acinetobacter junii]RTE44797.1 hypothetical protein EJJ36_14920 [Acinetobacter junii]VTX91262.1 Uncharacterised protein [Acinetobacter junii]
MSNSPSHIPIFIHPAIKNLNVRQISKIIATKIIETTALQLQFNSTFCSQLDVAQHLNTYEAIAYFVDHHIFDMYGFNKFEIVSFNEIYDELYCEFKNKINYQMNYGTS